MGNDNLLKEELKRHIQLLEYTFYMEDDITNPNDEVENLLLGAAEELNEQDPVGDEGDDPFAEDPFATEEEGEEIEVDTEETEEVGETDPCYRYCG